jgi:hypothetical protein
MDIPVRLFKKASGEICEVIGPGESGQLLVAQGISMPDQEAKRLGITDYLQRRQRQAVAEKAVEQSTVEDKAVGQDAVEDKDIMIDRSRVNPIPAVAPPSSRALGEDDPGRRTGGGRRG